MLRKTSPQEIRTYLTDASNIPGGHAEGVVFPENEKEIAEFLRDCYGKGMPVTVAGGGTGLVGGRAPFGGWVLATDQLSKIQSIQKDPAGYSGTVVVQPGTRLRDLHHSVEAEGLLYPPDPTSGVSSTGNAFAGGTVATNASGPRTFKYGPTRNFIRRLRVVLASGDILEIKRGQFLASGGTLEIPLRSSLLKLPVPTYTPPAVKNTAGYFAGSQLDAIDLFIGSEGTLGVVTEIEMTLLPRPQDIFSCVVFFPTEESSWRFSAEARTLARRHAAARNDAAIQARALEYMDGPSLDLVRKEFENIPHEARAAIYFEQECQSETEDILLDLWSSLFEKHSALPEFWIGRTESEEQIIREFRHAIPVKVRDFLKQHGTAKVGTDMSVPAERFEDLMLYQRRCLEELKLPHVTFGHIGDAHVHLNILPKNQDEHDRAWDLYREFVTKAIELGGSVAGEHGIGKLKRPYLLQMFGAPAVQEMIAVKKALDPKNILGRGNLFEA